MRRSYKIAIIMGFLAVIYLLLPLFAGMVAQRWADKFLDNENKTLGNVLGIQLSFTQYHRGWFHSTANLQVEKKASDGSMEMVRTISVVIDHGPTYLLNGRVYSGFAMIKSAKMPINQDLFYRISFHENVGFTGERGAVIFFTRPTNANDAKPHDFQANSLVLNMTSNSDANQFLFAINGQGLHYQSPTQMVSVNAQNLNASLQADYLGDRHWKLKLGLGLDKDQLSAVIPGVSGVALTVNADQINLQGVHIDTQKMAKLLSDVVILKQATDNQESVKPTAWMALLQEFLTQIIHKDTVADIRGLSVTTPMGQIQGNYEVSFPALPDAHDYFDVVTRNVGALKLSVPSWTYTDSESNMAFALKNLTFNETNNTVFSRSSAMQIGEFDINDTNGAAAPLMAATDVSYTGELYGDVKQLSQIMQWNLNKVCFTNDCFNQIHGKLELMKMNYNAFRGIASATQQVVQYDPKQAETMDQKWMGLAEAYAKLITPKTQVVLSHDMNTNIGEVKIHGEISWPALSLNPTIAPTIQDFVNQSVYQLNMLFPAAYVDSFLSSQAALPPVAPASDVVAAVKTEPTFETQAANFLQYALAQGYLKKVGDAYVLDLSGKGSVLTINNTPWKAPQ